MVGTPTFYVHNEKYQFSIVYVIEIGQCVEALLTFFSLIKKIAEIHEFFLQIPRFNLPFCKLQFQPSQNLIPQYLFSTNVFYSYDKY